MRQAGRALVLVVDDEPMVLAMTRDALESAGFRVVTAQDGRGAVGMLRTLGWEVGVAILDYVMPGLDGESVFREFRRINPDLPVLFCTGRIDRDLEQRLTREKVQVLTKPIRPSTLIKAVELALGATTERLDEVASA